MGAKGAPETAPDTSGLDALDRDRAASLADEGGAAGALVESQESPESQETPDSQESQENPGSLESRKKKSLRRPGNRKSLEGSTVNPIAAALTVAAGVLTGIVVWRIVRR